MDYVDGKCGIVIPHRKFRWSKPEIAGAAAPKPPALCGHQTLLLPPHILLVVGGGNGSDDCGHIHAFNMETLQWMIVGATVIPPARVQSCWHSMVCISTTPITCLTFGGFRTEGCQFLNTVHKLTVNAQLPDSIEVSVETVPVSGNFPSPRSGHSAVFSTNTHKMYVIGGGSFSGTRGPSRQMFHGDLYAFDTRAHTWMELELQGTLRGLSQS